VKNQSYVWSVYMVKRRSGDILFDIDGMIFGSILLCLSHLYIFL
jgi:hypothetical protein